MDCLLQFLHRDTLDWSAVQSKSHRLLQFSFLPSWLPAWPPFSLSPGGKEGKLQQTVGFRLNSWSMQVTNGPFAAISPSWHTMEKLLQKGHLSPMPFFSLTDPSWLSQSSRHFRGKWRIYVIWDCAYRKSMEYVRICEASWNREDDAQTSFLLLFMKHEGIFRLRMSSTASSTRHYIFNYFCSNIQLSSTRLNY